MARVIRYGRRPCKLQEISCFSLYIKIQPLLKVLPKFLTLKRRHNLIFILIVLRVRPSKVAIRVLSVRAEHILSIP
jgi:hypothetical protein